MSAAVVVEWRRLPEPVRNKVRRVASRLAAELDQAAADTPRLTEDIERQPVTQRRQVEEKQTRRPSAHELGRTRARELRERLASGDITPPVPPADATVVDLAERRDPADEPLLIEPIPDDYA